jgi:hypothetical protein
MDFGKNIMDAVQNDTIQKLGGFLLFEKNLVGESGRGILDNTMVQLDYLLHEGHIPNLQHMLDDATRGASKEVFKTLLMLGIGGWIAEEVNIHPQVTRIGKVAKGFAINGGIGAVIGSALLHASVAHSPSSGSQSPSYSDRNEGVRGL